MPSSQWRRYDKMRTFPDALLITGDAICSFNPIYGQGMTVSALDAAALRDCLRHGSSGLARKYFQASAKPIGVAWQMAAGSDLAFPEVEGKRSQSMLAINRLLDLAATACEGPWSVLSVLPFLAVPASNGQRLTFLCTCGSSKNWLGAPCLGGSPKVWEARKQLVSPSLRFSHG